MTFLTYTCLSFIWLTLILRPVFMNGPPLWWLGLALAGHILCLFLHHAGHAFGAARYGLSGGGLVILLGFGGTSIPGFDDLREFAVKRSAILGGPIATASFAVISFCVAYFVAGANLPLFMNILGGCATVDEFKAAWLGFGLLYFGYISACKVLFDFLPLGRLDGPMLLQAYYQEHLTSVHAMIKLRSIVGLGAVVGLAFMGLTIGAARVFNFFDLGYFPLAVAALLCGTLCIYWQYLHFEDPPGVRDFLW